MWGCLRQILKRRWNGDSPPVETCGRLAELIYAGGGRRPLFGEDQPPNCSSEKGEGDVIKSSNSRSERHAGGLAWVSPQLAKRPPGIRPRVDRAGLPVRFAVVPPEADSRTHRPQARKSQTWSSGCWVRNHGAGVSVKVGSVFFGTSGALRPSLCGPLRRRRTRWPATVSGG